MEKLIVQWGTDAQHERLVGAIEKIADALDVRAECDLQDINARLEHRDRARSENAKLVRAAALAMTVLVESANAPTDPAPPPDGLS